MEFRIFEAAKCVSFMLPTPPPSQALKLLIPHADTLCSLLQHRIYSPCAPTILDPITVKFLKRIPDSLLQQIELEGASNVLPVLDIPPLLRNLTVLAREVSQYFPHVHHLQEHQFYLEHNKTSWKTNLRRRVKLAKLYQIESVTECVRFIVSQANSRSVQRVIDVGAGHAHLAASLGTVLDIPTIAIDRDPALVQAAKDLYGSIPNLALREHAFETLKSISLSVTSNDMLVGLHPCGRLGELLVSAAAEKEVAAVFLVSCCLQKLDLSAPFRHPLSDTVRQEPKLRQLLMLDRALLGATNRSRNTSLKSQKARMTRYALRKLLDDRGFCYEYGAEASSLSRHVFKHGLLHVSKKFEETRNIDLKLEESEAIERMKNAAVDYRQMQVLNIPRAIAGEVLEMAIVLDRASCLEKSFPTVRTMRVWPESISVKNLAIAAWR